MKASLFTQSKKEKTPLPKARLSERLFHGLALASTLIVLGTLASIFLTLFIGAFPALKTFGFSFFTSAEWNPVTEEFGMLAPLYGTLMTTFIAMIFAIPSGLGIALFITEFCPKPLATPLTITIELLAGIPSIVFGIWGAFALAPLFRTTLQPFLIDLFANVPFLSSIFAGPAYGLGFLTAGFVLSLMIIPLISSVSRDVLLTVPPMLKEAAYGMGCTRFEVIRNIVFAYAKEGLFGSVILGLGRALGETMAVTFIIGNVYEISASLFSPGTTISAAIANEFSEADGSLYVSSLIALGLVLFIITFSTLLLSNRLILRMRKKAGLS